MIKNLSFFVLVMLIVPFHLKADWVSVNDNKSANTPPQVSLLSDDASGTVIHVDLAGFDLQEFITDGKTYHSVDLLNDILTNQPGFPEMGYIAKVLAVPDNASLSVEVLEMGEMKTFKNINLPPARESWWEGKPESPYVENAEVYLTDGAFPQELARIEPPSIFRDFRVARVSVFPMQYNPAKKELSVASSITIRVNYGSGEAINPKTSARNPIPKSFGKLYRSFIFNYQSVLDKLYDGKEAGHELMLCIMDDMFTESFERYATWKKQSGVDVHVTAFSDISANANNPDIIKDHIEDAYYNWDYPPTYVLIVGDDGIFPKKIVYYDYSFPNEDYFVEIEGNDHFPEMMIGRFTNQGDYRMQVMINKYMLYEQTPYTEEGTDWFTQGTFCSNNAYESQVYTKRFAANKVLDYGFTHVDTMMSDGWGSGCTYDIYDIMETLNQGRSYLNYRGEGWSYGWYANCYDFHTDNVSNLNNGQKFTFVTSIGCGVAMFDTYGGNCFGEEWIQLGTLSEPRGGIGFCGPVSNTHTTYNNRIDKGIYQGMFSEGMDTPGQALLRGKLYMYNVFGTDSWVEYHYRVYAVLGDPSIRIWKDVPLEIQANNPTSITIGTNQLDFDVTFSDSGLPADSAEICIAADDFFMTAYADMNGHVAIQITPETTDSLMLTIRGHNKYPYQSKIEVTQPYEHVVPLGDPEYTQISGNNDGFINPSENWNIEFLLKNWGNQTAANVSASIETENPEYVEIVSTGSVNYGNMSAGATATGDPFEFMIKPECPVGEVVTIKLYVTSNSFNWDYHYEILVHGCNLENTNYVIHDGSTAIPNYRMDPGETVQIAFSVKNIGDDIAPDVTGLLASSDPYITIIDNAADFGSLNVGNSSICASNNFKVSVDASCPTDFMAAFTLTLTTDGGMYPYESVKEIGLPVGKLVPNDYTGPDDYGYYAYSSDDSFFEENPEYEWLELDGLGTSLYLPVSSDYTQAVDLPFSFKYYGLDYTKVRISTDGWAALGNGTQTAPINYGLPHSDNVNNMVAVFWDDLYDDYIIEGEIWHYYDEANNRFIIEWDSITHNDYTYEQKRECFQIQLYDPDYSDTPTGDGEIIFQYKRAGGLESNTVGIENNGQDIGLQYLYDQNYNVTATELKNEYAIKFTTEPPHVNIIVSVDENLAEGSGSVTQNFPNPFSNSTYISYTLPNSGNVLLQVFDAHGKLVCTLKNGINSSGKHIVEWKGTDEKGNKVQSGIYLYRLSTGEYVETHKMFLLK